MARMKILCDADRCIECNACVTACKNEHEVPWGINRRRVGLALIGSLLVLRDLGTLTATHSEKGDAGEHDRCQAGHDLLPVP